MTQETTDQNIKHQLKTSTENGKWKNSKGSQYMDNSTGTLKEK
jgi:hypothetical protein